MKVNKFTIDRAKWLQGESNSLLHRKSDDKMCCLGFFSLACGIKKKNITNLSCPESALEEDRVKSSKYPEWVFDWTVDYLSKNEKRRNSDIINDLMTINDDTTELTLAEKEAQIKTIFAKQGVEVEFTGEFPAKYALKLEVIDKWDKSKEELTLWFSKEAPFSYYKDKSNRGLFASKESIRDNYKKLADNLKECGFILKRKIFVKLK